MKVNIISVLDIRPRLLLLIFFSTLLFLPLRSLCSGILLGTIFSFSIIVDGPAATLKTVKRILPILILVTVLTPIFNRDGEVCFQAGYTVLVTSGGLHEVLRMVIRFTGITLLFALFYHSTLGDELITGLRWFGLPFRAALVINLALRFIPEMFTLYQRVRDAHSLREENSDVSGAVSRIWGRFLKTLPHLTSVLILSIKKIAPLSMSLHLRGGDISKGRTSLNPLTMNRRVSIQLLIVIFFSGGIIAALVMNPRVWYTVRV